MVRDGLVRDCLACAVVIAFTTASSYAGAGPRAVIELFTSQGCSSCPPADKLLAQFTTDPSLIPISLPIDYWDYLGWKDTLADPRNSARQRAYSRMRGDREVYTPQVVVNGSMHALGSDRDAIEAAIALSRKSGMALTLPVTMGLSDGELRVSVPGGAEGRSPAEVWICGLLKAATVAIGRGENRGKTITYHNVARQWLKLGTWDGNDQAWTLPVREIGDGIDEAVVLVQSGTVEKPSAVYGAAATSLH
ncbi:MAG TPA: DUF1223 domain-containing protein [Xanthobacteraceae bacterium]|nr:DUF1223 domain-containing protein [Xanthobacteraceae bacterium]